MRGFCMRFRVAIGAVALVALAGCGGKDAKPTGQVVATVDGTEITAAELRAEMGNIEGATPQQAKQIQEQALLSIVNRKIAVGAARAQKLDKTPQAEIARHRAVDLALIDLLQAKLRSAVPAASADEAQSFISDHPQNFSGRKLYIVDQVIAQGTPPAVIRQMAPLNTLEEIVALLDSNKVAHNATVGTVDSLSIAPEAAAKLASLKPGEVFVTPGPGGLVRISRIRETVSQPLAGPEAIKVAQGMIQQQRTQTQVGQQLEAILKAGRAKVKLNGNYSLPPQPKPGT